MLISVICILLGMMSKILAYKEYSPNVGSVLFSSKDIKTKHHWSKEELSLLRARRYFQSLLPPIGFLSSLNNEAYVDKLLEYCRNAYSNVKREAKDRESDVTMTKALSDSLGGYLKVYVLPIAKLHYYAGTISSDHITKLFDIYDEIKNYLDTDGNGWRSPEAISSEHITKLHDIYDDIKKYQGNANNLYDVYDELKKYLDTDSNGGRYDIYDPIKKYLNTDGSDDTDWRSLEAITKKKGNKAYDIYDEVKKYLGTEGEGWRGPDANLLKSVSIDLHTSQPNNDSCNSFAYFEKTKNGLSIALPQVHWSNRSSTMYFPLKNVTSIPLNAPNQLTLYKYYEAATNCLRRKNPSQLEKFENKFQTWLSNDIVPHLRDNNLYLGLGKVLSLLNSTFYINNMELTSDLGQHQIHCYCWSSNKMLIIIILLIIEAIWCILALILFIAKKNKKKKKNKSSNMFMFVQRSEPDNQGEGETFFGRLKQTKNVEVHPRPPSYKDLKDTHTQRPTTPPYDRATAISLRSLCGDPCLDEIKPLYSISQKTITAGTGSQTYLYHQSQSTEAIIVDSRRKTKKLAISDSQHKEKVSKINRNIITFIDETTPSSHRLHTKTTKKEVLLKKGDLKKTTITDAKKQSDNTGSKNVTKKRSNTNKDAKTISNKRHDKSKRRVRGQLELKMVQSPPEMIMSEIKTESANSVPTSHECFCTPNIQSESEISDVERVIRDVSKVDPAQICPCTDCLAFMCPKQGEDVSESADQVSRSTEVNNTAITDPFCSDQSKTIQLAMHMEKRLNNTDFEIDASKTSHFELVFEEPRTEISIDVSGPGLNKRQRSSRIPKLSTLSHKSSAHGIKERLKIGPDVVPKDKRRSMIPQPKKRSVDDNILTEPGRIIYTQTKLNETL